MKKYTLVNVLLTLAALNAPAANATTSTPQPEHHDVNISTSSVENRLSRISAVLKTTENNNSEELIAGGWGNGDGHGSWNNGNGRSAWANGGGGGFANSNGWRNAWGDGGGFRNYY